MQMNDLQWIMNDLNEFEESKEAFWESTLKLKVNFNFKINSKIKLENFSLFISNLGKCLVLYKFGNRIVFRMNPATLILLMV